MKSPQTSGLQDLLFDDDARNPLASDGESGIYSEPLSEIQFVFCFTPGGRGGRSEDTHSIIHVIYFRMCMCARMHHPYHHPYGVGVLEFLGCLQELGNRYSS